MCKFLREREREDCNHHLSEQEGKRRERVRNRGNRIWSERKKEEEVKVQQGGGSRESRLVSKTGLHNKWSVICVMHNFSRPGLLPHFQVSTKKYVRGKVREKE